MPDNEELKLYRCYSCGTTSKNGTFHMEQIWTDFGYEYDCTCSNCGSTYTAWDGEAEPEHYECGSIGWDCWKCNKFCCEECWEWSNKTLYHEEKTIFAKNANN